MNETSPRTVIITGTSSGFGLLVAVALAKRGYQVIATMRDLAGRQALVDAARLAGVEQRIHLVQLDVTDTTAIDAAVDEVVRRFGRIDVLVNNAGFAVGGFVEDVPLAEWRRQFDTNVFGAIAMTQAILPHMRANRHGTIVNVSSISGRFGFPGMGPYSASKFALEGFSEALRLEMAPYGVRVIVIEPASYKTAIWRKGLEAAGDAAASAYPREMQVMLKGVRRIAETASDPQEVADLIARVVDLPHPRLRYPIGPGVRWLLAAKSVLPWSWLERRIARRFSRVAQPESAPRKEL